MAELKVDLHCRLTVTRGMLKSALLVFLAAGCATELGSESVTMTTYYPAPSGVYSQMITTNTTVLARNGGTVTVGDPSAAPGTPLIVNGAMRVASYPIGTPPAGTQGAIFYDSTNHRFMGFYGGATPGWRPMSGGSPEVRVYMDVAQNGPQDREAVFCPAGWTLVGCTGSREEFLVDQGGEDDHGYIGTMPVINDAARTRTAYQNGVNPPTGGIPTGCKTQIDGSGGDEATVFAFCLRLQ
jgi:hypothetical protein